MVGGCVGVSVWYGVSYGEDVAALVDEGISVELEAVVGFGSLVPAGSSVVNGASVNAGLLSDSSVGSVSSGGSCATTIGGSSSSTHVDDTSTGLL